MIGGRYRLERLLGEGGMGRVWSATHVVTRRAVAIKFLKEAVQHKSDVKQRFLREATAASALRHPNVVEVIDVFDLEDQSPAMVMELLEGETLGAKLAREERLSAEETSALMLPVVDAVSTAHALGIVHRDLKPENIFIARAGATSRVKVLDFGIAKLSAEHYLEIGQSVLETEAGAILGTPCYMAPEQLTSSGVDHNADTWSLGVILYECLSGTRPVEGRNLAEVIARLLNGVITPLERLAPELPHDLTGIVQQMLSRDVKRRPADFGELTKILSRYSHVRVASPEISDVGHVRERISAVPVSKTDRKPSAQAPSPTMISAPALGLDTGPVESTDPTSSTPQSPLEKRRGASSFLYALIGGAVLGVLAVVGLLLRPAERNVDAPAAVQSPSAMLPAGNAPAPTSIPAQPAAAAPVVAAPVVAVPVVAVPAEKPSAAPAKSSHPAPPRPGRTPSSGKNDSEGALFSGRK